MKRTLFCIAIIIAALPARGQRLPEGTEHLDPSAGWAGPAVFRTEFISYDTRQLAEEGDPAKNKYYLPVGFEDAAPAQGGTLYRTVVDIPYMWLDRDVYLQITGLDSYYIYIGNEMIAYGEDSRIPMQFLISDHITDGENTVVVLHTPGIVPQIEENATPSAGQRPEAFIFSQPKICIEDYRLRFFPDSTDSYGIFNIRIAVSNSYNTPEEVTVGYDIYSPQGKLQYYDMRQLTVDGRGKDTLRLNEFIYQTNPNEWTPDNPALYYGMLTVRRGNRMVEYIPFKIGFGKTEYADGTILRNGRPVSLNPVTYNAVTPQEAREVLSGFKARGFNTICPDYPQPAWFYELCDEAGFYVIDNADINPLPTNLGRIPGGELANSPEWLGRFLKRAESLRARNINRTSVIGWSLGGDSGNGYNLYKTYIDLKEREPFRPVIYKYTRGEWNSDIPFDSDGL
ncbi:MAG: hypothetical protein LUD76_10795 [Alistipes sp.]|nr:hypothetical protein [Alistipes sp.]